MGLGATAFAGYHFLCGCIFLFAPQMPTADTMGDKTPVGSDAHAVSLIYAQVVGAFMMCVCVTQCPGPRGLIMAILCIMAVMAKHTFVDGLALPMPPKVMACVALACSLFAGQTSMGQHTSKAGIYFYVFWMCVVAFMAGTDPVTMLTDTYPKRWGVKDSGDSLEVGLIWCEVIALVALMNALAQCPGALGRSMAMCANCALMAYHLNKGITPPPVIMIGASVTTLLQLKELLLDGEEVDESATRPKKA